MTSCIIIHNLKNENWMFASTTNFISSRVYVDNSFSILSITALFTSLPNLKQSPSVSSLRLNNSSNNLIEASFLNSSSTALSATLDHSTSGNSCFTLLAILIFNSAFAICGSNHRFDESNSLLGLELVDLANNINYSDTVNWICRRFGSGIAASSFLYPLE